MDTDALLNALAKAGARRQTLRRRERQATREVAQLAKQAHAAGIPKLQIARAARISRTALDAMLKR